MVNVYPCHFELIRHSYTTFEIYYIKVKIRSENKFFQKHSLNNKVSKHSIIPSFFNGILCYEKCLISFDIQRINICLTSSEEPCIKVIFTLFYTLVGNFISLNMYIPWFNWLGIYFILFSCHSVVSMRIWCYSVEMNFNLVIFFIF